MKALVAFLALGLTALPVFSLAYSEKVHPLLTEEAILFYNEKFPQNKLTDEQKEKLKKGSEDEDDAPRWLNHFYDPINNRGLTINKDSWHKAKDWAQNAQAQKTFYRLPFLAKISPGADYTWQRAKLLWQKGKKEEAMLALGHVLHLIQDMFVPDHTRNDPHPGHSSPYENFTRDLKFDEKWLEGREVVVLENLDAYFDEAAKYSNENFYSKDTIDSDYHKPIPDYFIVEEDGGTYGVKRDSRGQTSYLIRKNDFLPWLNQRDVGSINYPLVLSDYQKLLTTRATQYGAGVIDLFFREVGKKEVVEEKKENPFNKLKASVSDIFSTKINDGLKEVAVIDLDNGVKKEEKPEPPVDQGISEPASVAGIDNSAPEAPALKNCEFVAAQSAVRQPVVINEIAWMGTAASASNEWLELKNVSGVNVDISGWWLLDESGNIKINLGENSKINAQSFYLLERTDDSSVSNEAADLIYKGALSNSGASLRLFDKDCNLIDEVAAAGGWPAGDNSEKKTMERSNALGWQTGPVGGTPKKENSQSVLTFGGGSGGSGAPPQTSSSSTPVATAIPPVLISEFLFDAESSDENKEFIELYNPNDQEVDISGWSLQIDDKKKNFEAGNKIKPRGFFLIWRGDDGRADMKWASGSLKNTSATIYLVSNKELITGLDDPDIVDKIFYDKAALTDFAAGKSVERKAFNNGSCAAAQSSGEFLGNSCDAAGDLSDFELRATPNPQNSQNLPEPRDAPRFSGLRLDYDPVNLVLTAFWDGASGQPTSTILAVNEVGRSYDLLLFDVDSEGMGGSTKTSFFVPSFLSSVYFFNSGDTPTINLNFNKYPLVPGRTDRWKILSFFFNKEVEVEDLPEWLNTDNNFDPGNDAVAVTYPVDQGNTSRNSMILPDDIEHYGGNNGVRLWAYKWNEILPNTLRLWPSVVATTTDYLTIAFYDFFDAGGGSQSFRLKAIDKTKYFFQNQMPNFQPPQIPGEITFDFNESESQVTIKWEKATDPDTAEKDIYYELTINDQPPIEVYGFYYQVKMAEGDALNVSLRARDEFNNYSQLKTAIWRY